MKEVVSPELGMLLTAIKKDDVEQVQLLVKANPTIITQKFQKGRNCWHHISEVYYFTQDKAVAALAECVRDYFKDREEDCEKTFLTQDDEGNTSLQVAIGMGNLCLSKLLVSKYEEFLSRWSKDKLLSSDLVKQKVAALVNTRNAKGRTLLHDLPTSDKYYLYYLRYFISKGGDINIPDNEGNRPYDSWGNYIQTLYRENNILYALTMFYYAMVYVKYGADPNRSNSEGETLISIGEKYSKGWTDAHSSNLRRAYQTWKKATQGKGKIATHIAQASGNVKASIMSFGINICGGSAKDEELYALFAAIEKDDTAQVRKLININPLILTKRTKEGYNFWHIIGMSLFEHSISAIITVAECAYKHLKNTREGYHSFFLAQDNNGNTALHLAMEAGQEFIARILLHRYEEVLEKDNLSSFLVKEKLAYLINMCNLKGKTIMHYIPLLNYFALYKIQSSFLKEGDITIADNEGNRPYDAFGIYIKQSYEKGKALDAFTAFDYARIYVKKGADPTRPNRNGETIIRLAEKYTNFWDSEDTEGLKAAYQMSHKRKLHQNMVNDQDKKALTENSTTSEKGTLATVIELSEKEEVSSREWFIMLDSIERSDFSTIYQLIKTKPTILTKKVEGWNFWHVFANSPRHSDEEIEMVALWARNYLKGFPGGYDSFFLAQNEYGNTALQIAIRLSHKGLAERLLKIYERILESDGLTVAQIQKKVATFLNIRNSEGKTFLYYLILAMKEALDLNALEFFVSKGANVNFLDNQGEGPCDIWCLIIEVLYEDSKTLDASTAFNFARIFAEYGTDPDKKNIEDGETLINITEKYTTGWTPKHSALIREIYQLCLKEDSDLKCRAEDKVAPSTSVSTLTLSKEVSKDEATDSETQELAELFTAIETNDIDYIKSLLEENPNVLTKRNEQGRNCWHLIANSSELEHNTIKTFISCSWKHLKYLPDRGDNFFLAQDNEGNTALQIAITNGQHSFAMFLLESYEEMLVTEFNEKGLSSSLVHQKVAAFINMPDSNGKTVIHKVITSRHFYYFEYFIFKGGDVSLEDNYGNRPYEIWVNHIKKYSHPSLLSVDGALEHIRMYIKNGVNPDQPNINGETLLSVAQKYIEGWTAEDTEELRLTYLAKFKKDLFKNEEEAHKYQFEAAYQARSFLTVSLGI
jgi:ankyrin repeat protein